ncbi:MAG TPA: hypothetical protein DET40_02370 [Lentisphaeria bacterium]|nr:MAG: hypothetical protein A2X45_16965 [Lentisphaerae bacterium GWF2_50_93]HCE42377.1 hypothetical protein [Lentisphaeria bacterium]
MNRYIVFMLIFIFGALVGYFCGILFFKKEIVLDIKNGAIYERMIIYPIVVREQLSSHNFNSYNTTTKSSGKFKVLHVAWGNTHVSPSKEYDIYDAVCELGICFPNLSPNETLKIKREFLDILQNRGDREAIEYVRSTKDKLKVKVNSPIGVHENQHDLPAPLPAPDDVKAK